MAKSKAQSNSEYKQRNAVKLAAYRKSRKQLPQTRFLKYRYNAKIRGYIFTLTKEEFINIVNSNCFYCDSSQYIGVDRKNNEVGYTTDNSVACCATCNRMKGSFSKEDFIDKCLHIATRVAISLETSN